MVKLNLKTNNKTHELIKQYLEENASEMLANKINNGVEIIKEGKTLLNKKDLEGFMNYASKEAQKLVEKGARSACVYDAVVYGWAVHYFEEDSIEGKIYNMDGTEYKPVQPKNTTPAKPKVEEKPKPKQATLFDLMETKNEEIEEDEPQEEIEPEDEEECAFTDEEIEEAFENMEDEEDEETSNLISIDNKIVDKSTGEIIQMTKSFDKEINKMLAIMLDGKIKVQ